MPINSWHTSFLFSSSLILKPQLWKYLFLSWTFCMWIRYVICIFKKFAHWQFGERPRSKKENEKSPVLITDLYFLHLKIKICIDERIVLDCKENIWFEIEEVRIYSKHFRTHTSTTCHSLSSKQILYLFSLMLLICIFIYNR